MQIVTSRYCIILLYIISNRSCFVDEYLYFFSTQDLLITPTNIICTTLMADPF